MKRRGRRRLVPARAAGLFGVCLAMTVMLPMLITWPALKAVAAAMSDVGAVRERIAEQEALFPLFGQVAGMGEDAVPEGLAVPELRQPLAREDIPSIPARFSEMAVRSRVELVSASPQPRSLEDGRKFVRVALRARGGFKEFRPFLVETACLPAFECMERVEIAREAEGAGYELQVVAWLAVES